MSKQLVVMDTSCNLVEASLGEAQASDLAARFKALGDPIRLRLLSMIASAEGGEVCVCNLTGPFDVSGPTISHHLRVLREAGLIDGDRRGTWIYYRPIRENLRALASVLDVPVASEPA